MRGPALARVEEVMDEMGVVSKVDAALCEIVYEAASFGAAAPGGLFGGFVLVGETVGVELLLSAGGLVPDLKGNSSGACDHLSADRVCSPVGSICVSNPGTWNFPAAIVCAFCFQLLLAAMLGACFYVPGLLFKGMNKDECKKRKISSSFLPGEDLTIGACMRRAGGRTGVIEQ